MPSERLGDVIGHAHDPVLEIVVWQRSVHPVPPLLISRVAPVSHDPEKVGVVVVRGFGTGFTVGTVGAIVSTVNVPVAVDPEFPRLSFAVTMIVWVPSERVRAEVKLYDPDCTIPLPRKSPPLL